MQALFALAFLSCISVGKLNLALCFKGFQRILFTVLDMIQDAILDRLRLKCAFLVKWLRLNRSNMYCCKFCVNIRIRLLIDPQVSSNVY